MSSSNKVNICPNCEREYPSKNWKTKNGCIWCDAEYHRRKNESRKVSKKK